MKFALIYFAVNVGLIVGLLLVEVTMRLIS